MHRGGAFDRSSRAASATSVVERRGAAIADELLLVSESGTSHDLMLAPAKVSAGFGEPASRYSNDAVAPAAKGG
jgi:hypothetical protein